MLTHVTDGRARLRHAALRGSRAEEFAAMLRAKPGITEVMANARTGSLLVHFEPETVRIRELAEELECMLPAAEMMEQTAAGTQFQLQSLREGLENCLQRFVGQRQEQRRLVKRGMFLTFGGALAALAGSNRVHAVLGGAFVLLAAAHLSQNRRTLLR